MSNIKYLLSIAGGAILTYFKLYGLAYIIVGAVVLFRHSDGYSRFSYGRQRAFESKRRIKALLKKWCFL